MVWAHSSGEIESVIQQKIDQNRGKVRVAADLSERGIAEIKAEERMQGQLAEEALRGFEAELGLKSPETTPLSQAAKDLKVAAHVTKPVTLKAMMRVCATRSASARPSKKSVMSTTMLRCGSLTRVWVY